MRIKVLTEQQARESLGERFKNRKCAQSPENFIIETMLDDMREMAKDYEQIVGELELKIVKMENSKFHHERKVEGLKKLARLV